MNKKTAKLLPIAASLVLAVGIAGVIAGTKDAAAPVTAIGDTEFTIDSTNTTIVEEGGKNILRFVSTGQAAGAVIDFAIDGTYERDGRNVMITLKAGASITSTHIRELTQLAVNSNNAAGLKLETSRDGVKFVEVGGFNGENQTFEYPPHYFKLTAKEDVTIMQMTVFDNCTDAQTDASGFVGIWKGTLSVFDYFAYETYQYTDEITITVQEDGTVLGLVDYDPYQAEWNDEPTLLYLIDNDQFGSTGTLAADFNDPTPEKTFEIYANNGMFQITGGVDYEYELTFDGKESNPTTNLEIKESNSADSATVESLTLDEGDFVTVYAYIDYDATDDVTWTSSDPKVVVLGPNDKQEAVSEKDGSSFRSMKITAVAGGTAEITVSTDNLIKTIHVEVAAKAGQVIDTIPQELVGTTWQSDITDPAYWGIYVLLIFDENGVTIDDEYGQLYYADYHSFAEGVNNDGVYELTFNDGISVENLTLVYDSIEKTITGTPEIEDMNDSDGGWWTNVVFTQL